jgi:hypothetical protein
MSNEPDSTWLTTAQLNDLARDAQIAFCLGKYTSFEVAFARKVEAAVRAAIAKATGSAS